MNTLSQNEVLALAREIDMASFEVMLKTIESYKDAPPPIRIRELTRTLALACVVEDSFAQSTSVSLAKYRRVQRIRTRITFELLPKARRKAADEFGRPYGWKYEGDFGLGELHTGSSLWQTWCETCGGLCHADKSGRGRVAEDHDMGFHTAFCKRRNYRGSTEAVVQHTKHPFERCEHLATAFGLKVVRLDWSWYGLPTAALFTRHVE